MLIREAVESAVKAKNDQIATLIQQKESFAVALGRTEAENNQLKQEVIQLKQQVVDLKKEMKEETNSLRNEIEILKKQIEKKNKKFGC